MGPTYEFVVGGENDTIQPIKDTYSIIGKISNYIQILKTCKCIVKVQKREWEEKDQLSIQFPSKEGEKEGNGIKKRSGKEIQPYFLHSVLLQYEANTAKCQHLLGAHGEYYFILCFFSLFIYLRK